MAVEGLFNNKVFGEQTVSKPPSFGRLALVMKAVVYGFTT